MCSDVSRLVDVQEFKRKLNELIYSVIVLFILGEGLLKTEKRIVMYAF